MFGLSFDDTPAIEPPHPARADIALFVGWTTRKTSPVPQAVSQWLASRGYVFDATLRDVPVPVDTWEAFNAVFDWRARAVEGVAFDPLLGASAGAPKADDVLGLAVRDFFANGGRKCLVVNLGDPWPAGHVLTSTERADRLDAMLPAIATGWQREGWRGIEQIWGLDEVALVLVPDLPALYADEAGDVPPDQAVDPVAPEVFVECATNLQGTPAVPGVRLLPVPRLSDSAFDDWNKTVYALRDRMARYRRDCMLLLALPLPARESIAARDIGAAVTVRSSMVQFATPWLKPMREVRTPQGLVAPDGALAGLVAGSVLTNGPVRPAAGHAPAGVLTVWPMPSDRELRTAASARDERAGVVAGMAARFSLFGPTARGIQLLSDVSASSIGAWQPAGTVRLLGQLLRTARGVGESLTFENSGEGLWAQVRGRFKDLLTRYWEAGALRGARVTDAFSVRCDRSVMSQSDIDNGRVVVLIEFAAQTAIERVRVHLALAEDGSVFWQDAAAMDAVSVDATASGVTP
jgi:hypothetical protein